MMNVFRLQKRINFFKSHEHDSPQSIEVLAGPRLCGSTRGGSDKPELSKGLRPGRDQIIQPEQMTTLQKIRKYNWL